MATQISIFSKIFCLISILSLAHCAYSAAQHRAYLRLISQPFIGLPVDLILQTLASLLLSIISTAFVAGEFQPIRTDFLASKKSWDCVGNCPSFYIFDHRAKCLLPKFDD